MIHQIDRIKKTRSYLLEPLRHLSTEQWNIIPHGFSNNIAWNLGHMVAVQQGICYIKSDLPTMVGDTFMQAYKPGSRPAHFTGPEEIEQIKSFFFSTLDQLETDLRMQRFQLYNKWNSRYDIEVSNIQEALAILIYHEGLHSGVIAGIKYSIHK